jgi:NAD(P)-dependent dehydrogenase (short-subunit alcohol dehydrogenase family)
MTSTNSLSRTVIVTGCSTGIGRATAVALAEAGWKTIATVRDLTTSAPLREAATSAGVGLDIRVLDVTDADSIGALIAGVVADYGHLDAVVNNAGAASLGTIENMSLDEVRAAMEVNYFGPVALTQEAMPHLRASRGTVLTVSSVGGVVGQPFNEAYCAAKFAIEGFMESLHPVARTVGVSVIVIEPAAVASDFISNAHVDPAAEVEGAGDYEPAMSAYLERTMKSFDPAAAQTPGSVAAVIVESLSEPTRTFRVQTSEAAAAFVGIKLKDLDGSVTTGYTRTWVEPQ